MTDGLHRAALSRPCWEIRKPKHMSSCQIGQRLIELWNATGRPFQCAAIGETLFAFRDEARAKGRLRHR
ncbi:MAG TPA: hypothetical protein VN915_01075 [Elusimicrobiota bacterium]|nr:hypothetical protein [Elusimicrobiota bacterium]